MPKLPIYFVIVLLVLAATPLPYGFYTLIRIIVCLFMAWAAVIFFKKEVETLPWIFIALAVLFNPIIPVYLSKEIWVVIDLGCAGFLWVIGDKLTDVS